MSAGKISVTTLLNSEGEQPIRLYLGRSSLKIFHASFPTSSMKFVIILSVSDGFAFQ